MKRAALPVVVVALLAAMLPTPSRAVGTGTEKICPDWDPFCQQYAPACMICKSEGGRLNCPQVRDGETGHDNCRLIYNGAQAVSCTTWGTFCSQITVHP